MCPGPRLSVQEMVRKALEKSKIYEPLTIFHLLQFPAASRTRTQSLFGSEVLIERENV